MRRLLIVLAVTLGLNPLLLHGAVGNSHLGAWAPPSQYEQFGAARIATNALAIANTNLWDPLGSSLSSSNSLWIAASNLMWQATNVLSSGAYTTSNSLWVAASNLTWQATNVLGSAAWTSITAYDPAGAALNATNGLATGAFTSSNSLWLSSSNLVYQGTNALGSAAWTSSGAYDPAGAALTATNQLAIANTNLWDPLGAAQTATNQLAIANTNRWDPLGSAQNATNTARLAVNLAGTFDSLGAAQTATNQLAIANTNLWDPLGSAQAATNGLAIANSNRWDALGAAQTATNQLAIANTNLWDPLGSAQNATNTARLAINLASTFDAINAALNATNGLYQLQWPGYTWSSNLLLTAGTPSSQVTYGGGLYVYLCAATNFYSHDGLHWKSGSISVSGIWRKAALYANGQFVYLGQNAGDCVTSPDGINWTARTPQTASWLGVAFGNGLYVSVGTSGKSSITATSRDGVTWSSGASLSGGIGQDIIFANQLFVIAGDSVVWTSPDGATWASASIANPISKLAFGNGIFVAVSASGSVSTTAATSVNGTNWVYQTTPFAQANTLAFGKGVFVAANNSQTMTSVDGTNWVQVTTPTTGNGIPYATYGNGQFVVVGNTNAITSGHIEQFIPVNGNTYEGGQIFYGGMTNKDLLSADAVASDSNGKLIAATAISMGHIAQPGFIVTNGESQAITVSNAFRVDAAHALSLSNATASRVAMFSAANQVTNVSASGSVPIDADGTATTFAQINNLGKSITTNNATLTSGRVQVGDGGRGVQDATASGAVPIDADGTATTGAQIKTLIDGLSPGVNITTFTNKVNSQSANYALLSTDYLVLLTGAHTATLPTAVGIGGKTYVIKCSSAGTNAILTTSSQTIDGAAKWTNTAVNKFTAVISDNANWWVIGQN